MDDPLSQNPDSMWGRFFRNAELEKMVDQDLSRLYPEHGSYFQTAACQAMLRRILLLWCLRRPEYGYRQGMHELVAPLLYVLHVDVQHLSQVREVYEDQFCDKFDCNSFLENNLAYDCNFTKTSSPVSSKRPLGNNGDTNFQGSSAKISSLDELNPNIGTIVLLSDAYGAEGELGILLSERFMEHDAYCMFDALMSGAGGAVAMADYFSPSPLINSLTGLPPVIEASSALYHLLSIVDLSLHSHLVELGVEPQYFALRWLRVLFVREFLLDDLLIIWDEIFASPNGRSFSGSEDDMQSNFRLLSSHRGAFIAAIAVSMILHLRSSLLATENATSCLQRLLNFPENINVKRLIDKAKSLQALALDMSISASPSQGDFSRTKSAADRGYSVSPVPISPRTPLNLLPGSYWEEKWRVLHKVEEHKGSESSLISSRTKGSSDKEKFSLSRTESDPSPTKIVSGKKNTRFSIRRRLLDDLSHELASETDFEKSSSSEVLSSKDPLSIEVGVEKGLLESQTEQNDIENFICTEETCLTGHVAIEDNSSLFSSSPSPCTRAHDHENDSEKSSVISHLSIDDNDEETNSMEEQCSSMFENPPLTDSEPTETTMGKLESNTDPVGNQGTALKERKGKFQWFWKFGRSTSEGVSDKESHTETQRTANLASNNTTPFSGPSTTDECSNTPIFSSAADVADKYGIGTLKNLGQSMLENIQVIESIFQQEDRSQVGSSENLSRNILSGKGQVTTMAAIKELRKISRLLSEM
ncbi:uncharacterized protein LOC143849530 isoform X2 [Tasmannia lanceolata]